MRGTQSKETDRKDHVKIEAETGVIQTKSSLPESGRDKRGFSPRSSGGSAALPTP